MNKWILNLFTFSLSLTSLILIGILQKPFLSENFDLTTEDYQRQEDVKQAQLLVLKKLPTLGFDNLISDCAYLDFIQYNGDYYGPSLP